MATLILSEEEVKNKRVAAGVSVVLHIIILFLLFYLFAWRAPDPPAAENGIEINFGTDAFGSGDIQSEATPNKSENRQDSKPAPTEPEPRPEPKPTAQAAPPTPVEAPKVVSQVAESPVAVKEEAKPVVKPQPKEEPKKEPVKEEVKKEPEPVVNKAAIMGKKTDNTGTGKAGTSDEAAGNNNGNDTDKVGDKGIREGSLMSKNYEGKPGGGAGGLDMAGWRYDIEPKKDPYENETGFIKFKIKIDGDGNLISVDRVEGTVSPHVERWYRDQIRKTTFSRTGGNAGNSTGATGFVTFVIKAR